MPLFSGSLQLVLKNIIFKVYEGVSKSFAGWVDNEIYAYKNKHSLRSNTKGYGGKNH
jgi:hypothetical protein